MTNTKPANDTVAATVERNGNSITYRNIAARDTKRGPGSVATGQHAVVVPGKRVVLWGTRQAYRADGIGRNLALIPYRLEFRLGDRAEYASYNMSYTGIIVAIGAKTITIEDHGRRYRLDLHAFSWRNRDYDAEVIEARNAAWND